MYYMLCMIPRRERESNMNVLLIVDLKWHNVGYPKTELSESVCKQCWLVGPVFSFLFDMNKIDGK